MNTPFREGIIQPKKDEPLFSIKPEVGESISSDVILENADEIAEDFANYQKWLTNKKVPADIPKPYNTKESIKAQEAADKEIHPSFNLSVIGHDWASLLEYTQQNTLTYSERELFGNEIIKLLRSGQVDELVLCFRFLQANSVNLDLTTDHIEIPHGNKCHGVKMVNDISLETHMNGIGFQALWYPIKTLETIF